MHSKQQSQQLVHKGLIVILMIILAILSTYPAFTNQFFNINHDGDIHLARMESIYQALKVGHYPSLINLIGFHNHGIAMNAMYPWLTLLIYVLPRLVLGNPMLSLAVGFVIMNLLTIFNTYLLAKQLTRQKWIIWFSVIMYQFNTYHFTLMYSRIALGEAFGYTFLPLVMLGLIKIWQHSNQGFLYLALGMSLVANSHVLSLVMYTILIIVFELIRLIQHHFTWFEFRQIIYSGLVAVLLSAYSLYNIIIWTAHNKMLSPTPMLASLDPLYGFQKMLSNDISESATGAHMGIAITVIMMFLVFRLVNNADGTWKKWIIGALSILIISQNWFPWLLVANTPINLIQFTMRLLTIVSLLIVIGTCLFLNQSPKISKTAINALIIFIIFIGVTSITKLHQKIDHDVSIAQEQLTKGEKTKSQAHKMDLRQLHTSNYNENVNAIPALDYHLVKNSMQKHYKLNAQNFDSFRTATAINRSNVTYDGTAEQNIKTLKVDDQHVIFKTTVKHNTKTLLPLVGYHHINYNISLNNHPVNYQLINGQLQIKASDKNSQIKVSIASIPRNGVLLTVTLFLNLLILIIIVEKWIQAHFLI
ncbi:hypothetical protein [Lactiplantibacillus modestisalitolerans]|uniref:Cell surface protein n=1 Tax=Lactiplantibacillus modestisalitolerans TaxID=1457219 RepID=A0ABV5WRY4_9LACO|nr:hypothetical protein [Lactiplantibacillus modestisalitolerans]